MIYPQFFKKGDAIGVTAPSFGSESEIDITRIKLANNRLKEVGYNSILTDDCYVNNIFGSVDAKCRAKELEELIINKDVNGIICLGGGEFLVEMLPYLNLDLIKNNPKWIQGYSDVTGLTYMITTLLDIATIYSYNYRTYAMKNWHKSIENNLQILNGNLIEQSSFDRYANAHSEYIIGDEEFELDSDVKWNSLGGEEKLEFSGRIIGGCLDLIDAIAGTKFDGAQQFVEKYKDDGIIWYFDNCELSSEDIIRTMWKFKQLGYFENASGIIFGRTMLEVSNMDISFKDAVKHSLSELNIPIILDADIGHKPPQFTIINGALAKVKYTNHFGQISFRLT